MGGVSGWLKRLHLPAFCCFFAHFILLRAVHPSIAPLLSLSFLHVGQGPGVVGWDWKRVGCGRCCSPFKFPQEVSLSLSFSLSLLLLGGFRIVFLRGTGPRRQARTCLAQAQRCVPQGLVVC